MHRDTNIVTEAFMEGMTDLPAAGIHLEMPAGVHRPSPSSIELAGMLDVLPGEDILELGCGTGLLAIVAAKLGAGRVVATDLDPRALAAAARNVRINDVDERVELCRGSWYEALDGLRPQRRPGRFHMIIATPPQTPGPAPFGPRYGGWDGLDMVRLVIEGAPAVLDPLRGRLWLMAISLSHPQELLRRLEETFSEVSLVRETERIFTAEEYESMAPGLFDHLLRLRTVGKAEFIEVGNDRYAFRNLFLRASGPRTP